MCRIIIAILIMCFLLMPTLTSLADVVTGNDFLRKNEDKTEKKAKVIMAAKDLL